jgi:hypothetical protein
MAEGNEGKVEGRFVVIRVVIREIVVGTSLPSGDCRKEARGGRVRESLTDDVVRSIGVGRDR